MARRWVIPDIHGYAKTLATLMSDLVRPMRSDELYFLGDYVDRGPDSKGVIDLIRGLDRSGFNVTALRGNHEDIMVELYDAFGQAGSAWWFNFASRKNRGWLDMGGKATLASFKASAIGDIPPDYIEWMRELPYYHPLERFVLVHAGLNFTIDDPFEDLRSMLWLREYEIRPEKIGGRKIIHGHVPVNLELITQSVNSRAYKFIDLDNGPYLAGREGFGNLVALELNSMEVVIQPNVD